MSHLPHGGDRLGMVAPPGETVRGNGTPPEDPVVFRVAIEYHKSGQITTETTDPLARMIIYGLLEIARDVAFKNHLAAMQAPAAGPKIQVVHGDLPPMRRPG